MRPIDEFRDLEMKKLLLCLSFVVLATFCSCTKETTYTFTDNTDYSGINLTEQYIRLMEYDVNGNCVANNSLESPTCGKAYVFTANDRTELVKVYLSLKIQSVSLNRWVQQVYYLDKGKNVDISIDGHTLIGPSEP